MPQSIMGELYIPSGLLSLAIGLNAEVVQGMTESTGDARFVLDSYRRLNQMFGTVVQGSVPDFLPASVRPRNDCSHYRVGRQWFTGLEEESETRPRWDGDGETRVAIESQ